MNAQNYTINIRPGWGISPVVKVSQGDVGRPLAFTIMDGQDAITLSGTATVKITGTKPSGLGFTQDCTLSGNTASIDTVATMTQEAGSVPAELIVTDGSTVIGTANFVMYVEPAAHPEGTTDGDAETARDLMTRAQAAVEQAETAAQSASDSAASIAQAGIDASTATSGQVPTADGSGGWDWADQQGAGGGTSDDIENVSSVSGSTVSDALDTLSDEIANLEGGAPTPVATVAGMVDTTKIYLYTGSETGYNAGHWYYYSGGQWVDGGRYGQASSMSEGVKTALLTLFNHIGVWTDTNAQSYIAALQSALYPPTNLISISAVYTQSGIVYTSDTLDDLKADLVVTGLYDDSSSREITDYTLSGELETGVSTITVAYGGKTTTFTVNVTYNDTTVVYRLPAPTVFDGSTTYVNTGVAPFRTDHDFTFVATFKAPVTQNTYCSVWSSGDGSMLYMLRPTGGSTGIWNTYGGGKTAAYVGASITITSEDDVVRYVFRHKTGQKFEVFGSVNGTTQVNGTLIGNATMPTSGVELRLGRSYANNTYLTGTINEFVVYERALTDDEIASYIAG